MGFKTGATIKTGGAVSEVDRERSGLGQLAKVKTPVDRLGVLPTGGPTTTGTPGQQFDPGSSPTPPSPTNTIADPLAALFGADFAYQTKAAPVRLPTAEQHERAFQAPGANRSGQSVSKADATARGVPEVGAVSSTNAPFALQTPESRSAEYRDQVAREQIPQFSVTNIRLREKEAAAAAGTGGSALDLLSEDDSSLFVGALETNTEHAFSKYAAQLQQKLEKQAKGDNRLAEILTQAGIAEQGTSNVKPDAARGLLLTTAVEGKTNDRKKSDEFLEASNQVDLWHSSNGKEGIPEAEVAKSLQYQVMQPTFDRQKSQTTLPARFQQIYGGLANAEDSAQSPGRITQPENIRSPLNAADQSYLTVALFDTLKQMGLVDEVFRTDPDSGRNRGGYEKTNIFDKIISPINDIISDYDERFNVGLSLTPLPGGVPVGHSAAFHNTTTRSPGKIDLDTGGSAYKAADIAGRTPFTVSDDALVGNAWLMSNVVKSNRHALGFFESPFASFFLLDKKTFFKYVPTAAEINSDFELQKKDYDAYVKNRNARGAVDDLRSPPTLLPSSAKDYTNADEFLTDFENYRAAAETGSKQAVLAYENFLNLRVYPARNIFNSVSGGYLKDVMDGARLNGKSFYYPQTIQAGTTRTQLATTTLNYQASKKARGMIANPLKYQIRTRTADDIRAGRGKRKNKFEGTQTRNIDFEAMIARNLIEGNVLEGKVDRLASLESQADALSDAMALQTGQMSDLEQVARFVSKTMRGQDTNVKQWATTADTYINDLKTNPDIKAKDIRPDRGIRGASPFPQFEVGNVNPIDDKILMDKLAQMMDLADANGNAKGKSDHADFVLRSLKALGDYIDPSRGLISSDLIVEPDGIASGLTIQGKQFGDEDYLKHGGVMYDGEKTKFGETTPLGDMRDLVHQIITTGRVATEASVIDKMQYPIETQVIFESIYNEIANKGKVKALHKAAAMTVAYSMDPKQAAKGSVEEFFESIRGTELHTFILNEGSKIELNTQSDIVDQMVLIETTAIIDGLGISINQAKAVENGAGLAKLVNEIYEFKGASGWMMQLAGYESVEVASEIYIPVDGGKSTTVSTYVTFGDPAAAGKSKKGAPDRKPGTKGEKQAAVMPTQGIDAAIAQETMIGIHKELAQYDATKPTNVATDFAWGGQVFDAFVLDIGSYRRGVDIANKKFQSVNNNYSILDEHIVAVKKLMTKAEEKARQFAKEGRTFDVSPEGEFRGMYYVLSDIKRIANKIKFSKLEGSTDGAVSVAEAMKHINSSSIGFDVDGAQLTPKQFLNAIKVYMNVTATLPILNSMNVKVKRDRDSVDQKLRDQLNQGRPIRQYG